MSNTATAALWIMIATMLSKVLGFFREVVLATFYGTGEYADVFLLTLNIPGLVIAIIGSAIAAIYVPIYFKVKEESGEEESIKFTNNMINIAFLMAAIICIIGLIFTEEMIEVLAVGFEGAKFDLAIEFTRIMFSGVIFLVISRILSSYLQVNDNFVIPGLIGIPYNIIIIIAISLSTKTNLNIMAIGALFGMASQMIFQIPSALKKKYRYMPYINLKEENIREMIVMMLPLLIGVAIGQINTTVDKTLASTLGDGPLSALNYANKLNDFVMALFVTSIVTVIYPKLAKMTRNENKENFIDTIVASANSIVLLVLPITIGAIVLAEPIVRILFERGVFDSESTQMTYNALRLYSLGLVAMGLRDVLIRVFYSLSDTKTPMINGSIALLMNIVLNFILIKPFGYKGLAISTSIASIITTILMFYTLKKKTGYFGIDRIFKTGMKSLAGSLIMGVVSYFVYSISYSAIGTGMINEIISVGISVVSGALVYFIIIKILRVEEISMVYEILDKIKRKIIKK